MNRIVKISFNDILADYQQASDVINKACRHQQPMVFTGCIAVPDGIHITFEDSEHPPAGKFVIAPLSSVDEEDITAEVSSRYFAGFSTLAGFEINNKMWGIFYSEKGEEFPSVTD